MKLSSKLKRFFSGVTLIGSLTFLYTVANYYAQSHNIVTPQATSTYIMEDEPSQNTIQIGSFNLQTFGPSKASDTFIMDIYAKILCSNDITAIQEIRDKEGEAFPKLVDLVQDTCPGEWGYVIGERQGRTSSKEQYAFIYNKDTIQYTGISFDYVDSEDHFERPPFYALFNADRFSFGLLNVHLKPDDAKKELESLDEVVALAMEYDTDVISIGDFNADCTYLKEEDYDMGIIQNNQDTTTNKTDCTYDRILLSDTAYEDFSGESGVFRFDIEYSLTEKQAISVSDHYPIWSVWYTDLDSDSTLR